MIDRQMVGARTDVHRWYGPLVQASDVQKLHLTHFPQSLLISTLKTMREVQRDQWDCSEETANG